MGAVAEIFMSGDSQVVRLPDEFRLDNGEVYIEKIADGILLRTKKRANWDQFFDALDLVDTDDFLLDRDQLPVQQRDLF